MRIGELPLVGHATTGRRVWLWTVRGGLRRRSRLIAQNPHRERDGRQQGEVLLY